MLIKKYRLLSFDNFDNRSLKFNSVFKQVSGRNKHLRHIYTISL